jgi:hypothetical protein
MSDGTLPENKDELRSLREKTKNLRIAPLFPGRAPETEKSVSGRVYKAEQEILGMGALFGGFGINMGPAEKLNSVSFRFSEKALDLVFAQAGSEKVLQIGLEGSFITSLIDGNTYACVGRWRAPSAFEAEIRNLGSVSGSRLIFRFEDDKINLTVDPTMFMTMGPGSGKSPVYSFAAQNQ